MTHPLDAALDSVRHGFTRPGEIFAVGEVEARGARYRAFVDAPPDLPSFFTAFCGRYGDRTFLVDGDDRLSFAQTLALARQVAAGLIETHGVKPGDHVALAARNGAGWVIAYMGILMAGGVAALVNAFCTGEEMVALIEEAECTLVLADERRHAALAAVPLQAPVALLQLDVPVAEGLAPLLGEGSAALPSPGPDAPATILFTSGSTARSKAALSDQRAKVQGAFNFSCATFSLATVLTQEGRPPNPMPASLLNLPLFHVTAEVAVFLQSFVIGRKLVVMRKWDAREALRLIEAEGITYFVGVPLMGDEIVTHPERGNYDLSSLTDIVAGGAPRPLDHVPRIKAGIPSAWGVLGYGLTETNAVGCVNVRESYLERPASTGRPTWPLSELAIFGEDNAPLETGAVGEIGIRSIACISGYWKREEANATLFTPSGHVLTGDMGYLDEAGYLFIVDRKKDIIIRGGENISCGEVEAALYALPEVLEASVFGVPDERYGEVPVAFVHLHAGSALDGQAIRATLCQSVAKFKLPDPIVVRVEPLPRLGTEKIDKRACRALYLDGG